MRIFVYLTPLISLSLIWIYIPIMRGTYYIREDFYPTKTAFLRGPLFNSPLFDSPYSGVGMREF